MGARDRLRRTDLSTWIIVLTVVGASVMVVGFRWRSSRERPSADDVAGGPRVVTQRAGFGTDIGPLSPRRPEGGWLAPAFIENAGQHEQAVRFTLGVAGMRLFFTGDHIAFVLQEGALDRDPRGDLERQRSHDMRTSVVRMHVLGANDQLEVEGLDVLPGDVHYFRGRGARASTRRFARIVYREIYPSIDLSFALEDSRLKSEWTVRPGGSAEEICWTYSGHESLEVCDGALRIGTELGALVEEPPRIFQRIEGEVVPIEGRYRIQENRVGYAIEPYDRGQVLVIDPGLEWSTFLGGMFSDSALDLEIDAAGDVFVTGYTWSPDFPTTQGAFDRTFNGGFVGDAFVTKLDGKTSHPIWSTYLGGTGSDNGFALSFGPEGEVYVSGWTDSSDFPVTPGAFSTQHANPGVADGFVTKLDPSGSSLIYSTFLGGFATDGADDITVDASGHAYVTGASASLDFPVTPGAFATTPARPGDSDTIITKLDPNGANLVYSTYLGGQGSDWGVAIVVDASGHAYVAGNTDSSDFPTTPGAFKTVPFLDAFVTKLDPTGSSLIWSTALGGSANRDQARTLAVDPEGNVIVGGQALSSDFPTTPDAFDRTWARGEGFITKIDSSGSSLIYSTFIGGSGRELVTALTIDSTGAIYCTGATTSEDFPVTPGAFDTVYSAGGVDTVFLARLDVSGRKIVYATYLGGSNGEGTQGVALHGAAPDVYLGGSTISSDFPTTPGAFDREGPTGGHRKVFVTKLRAGPILTFNGTPSPGQTVSATVSSAPSAETGAIAQVVLSCSGPGSIPLPGGQKLPLTFDACTALSLSLSAFLRGVIDPDGVAQTISIPFPPAPPGITVHGAAFTYRPGGPVLSVTPPVELVTQ